MMPFSYHLSNLLLIALETMQLLVRIDLPVKEKVHFQEIVLSLIFQDSVKKFVENLCSLLWSCGYIWCNWYPPFPCYPALNWQSFLKFCNSRVCFRTKIGLNCLFKGNFHKTKIYHFYTILDLMHSILDPWDLL